MFSRSVNFGLIHCGIQVKPTSFYRKNHVPSQEYDSCFANVPLVDIVERLICQVFFGLPLF